MYFTKECIFHAQCFQEFEDNVRKILLTNKRRIISSKIYSSISFNAFIASYLTIEKFFRGRAQNYIDFGGLDTKLVDKICLNKDQGVYSLDELESMKLYMERCCDIVTSNGDTIEIATIPIAFYDPDTYFDFPISISKLEKTKSKYLILSFLTYHKSNSDNLPSYFECSGIISIQDIKNMIHDKRRISKDQKQLYLLKKDFSHLGNIGYSDLKGLPRLENYRTTTYEIKNLD